MAVNSLHQVYKTAVSQWQRCRDCFRGSDAVKDRGDIYLPPLDSHKDGNRVAYEAYKTRALFYNATGRTVEGLAGFVFQKPPTFEAPKVVEDQLEDVTLTGSDLATFALEVFTEILVTGRYGVLVDLKSEPSVDEAPRPYWAGYRAEDIISWDTMRVGGDPEVLTRVVLRECTYARDPKDEWSTVEVIKYRVLSLVPLNGVLVYKQEIYKQKDEQHPNDWVVEAANFPERKGKLLSAIPFQFIGTTSTRVAVSKPPLLDLVDVNLSHYRTMADLEHGRHFTALPTPWVSGLKASSDSNAPLSIGSGVAWELSAGGQAGMLEFTGAGLGSLKEAEKDKREMMAVLGARLLEQQAAVAETATAILLRHSGEGATLRTMTKSVSTALTKALQVHAWFLSTEDQPSEVDAKVDLNKDFFAIKLTPQEVQTQLQLLQAEAISYETFYFNLTGGGWTRPGITADEEKKQIAEEGGGAGPEAPPVPGEEEGLEVKEGEEEAAGPGMIAGDVVTHDEGPYKIVKRKGQFVVVKADNGAVVGKPYPDKASAMKQLQAIVLAEKKRGK